MSKGLLDIILDHIFDDEFKGHHGEKLTEKKLKRGSLFGRTGKTLRNVYVPKDDGETSEIDILFICQKGIFVFESKNYSGWIFGNEKDQYWTSSLPNGQKNRFYNPIKQNKTHIKWLDRYIRMLGFEAPMFSVIVFSERCELKKITTFSTDVEVIKRDKTNKTVKKIWDQVEDVLTEDQVDLIYEKLSALTDVDDAVKEAHVQSIKEKGDICPWCGNKLVLRTVKKGMNIGNQFYGCSSFPKCRYIKNL